MRHCDKLFHLSVTLFPNTNFLISRLLRLLVQVCNRSGADNRHFYDLQMTANIIKDINMKK